LASRDAAVMFFMMGDLSSAMGQQYGGLGRMSVIDGDFLPAPAGHEARLSLGGD